MSKHPDIDKVRKYLIESGYPEDGDALLSLVAVEAELAPKASNPHGLAEVLADMDLIIEQEHGSNGAARSLKEHLISFRDRIESALASAEPVSYEVRVFRHDEPNTGWWTCDKELYEQVISTGHTFNTNVKAEARALYTHSKPAAKVEALGKDSPPESLPGLPSREAAEQCYSITAFNYEKNPIGSHEWLLFYRGWLAGQAHVPAPTPASVPDAVLEVSRRLIREAIPATASGQTCFVPKYVIAQLADAIGFFTTPEPTP